MRYKEITEDIELFIDQTEEGFEVKSIFGEMDDGTEVYSIHGICNTIEEAEELINNGEKARAEWLSDLERVVGKLTDNETTKSAIMRMAKEGFQKE